jgi:hypothetical protein
MSTNSLMEFTSSKKIAIDFFILKLQKFFLFIKWIICPHLNMFIYPSTTLVHIFQLLHINFKNSIHCNIINRQIIMNGNNITTWINRFKYNITNNVGIYINISSSILKSNEKHQNQQHAKEPKDYKNMKTIQDLLQQNFEENWEDWTLFVGDCGYNP